jgi:RNA polymerase sigma-70 factor (ECF subfamily)
LRNGGGRNLINDDELIQRCRRGDSLAFDKLYAQYCKPLFNYIYKMINDPELAEDILQETFLKALTGNYEHRGKFSTWLYRVATNLSLNEIKKVRRTVTLEKDIPNPKDKPCKDMERKELTLKIEEAISSLPSSQKVAFCLKHFQGLHYEEIASIVGCPLGTVKSRIHSAVMNLRKYLEGYYEV